MSTEKKSTYINVDQLLPEISLEQAAAFYGLVLPDLQRIGGETRSRCFLNCGKTAETGERALAIQTGHPAKTFKCHQYSCGKSGNLVSLCDLMKSGDSAGGRPRGQRFKDIAADLLAMASGVPPTHPQPAQPVVPPAPALPAVNVPLAQSPNERARPLVDLDRKFVVDPAGMTPKASAYFRRRPFLSAEVCRRWRMGYLPRDTGEDKSGGTLRGRVVYPYLSEAGEVLTWFGRDPDYEEKHKAWEASDRSEREPSKFHFTKGFHRSLELFGQHLLQGEGVTEKLRELGLVVVEGPNDVIRFDTLGVPALGLCSNMISEEQATKLARWAQQYGGGLVTLFLDCDAEGENGMQQALGRLAPLIPVRLGWSGTMHGGKFKGRQPESLTAEEWQQLHECLRCFQSA